MSVLRNLPLDILPSILHHLTAQADLAAAVLVSQLFYSAATPFFYRSISLLPWKKNSRDQVFRLFTTLELCPHLARHVRRLEIRVFLAPGYVHNEVFCSYNIPRAIRNCVNLRSCTWTRYGTLNNAIIEALQSCPITEFEFNADPGRDYVPSQLLAFDKLESLQLVLPGRPMDEVLVDWVWVIRNTLRSLSIICSVGNRLVTDASLARIAPNLINLEHLQIIGCVRVTHLGIANVLFHSQVGIRTLHLQGLSPSFDLNALHALALDRLQSLRKLQHVRLTMNPTFNFITAILPVSFRMSLTGLLSHTSDLQTLHISARNAIDLGYISADALFSEIAIQHGTHLVRLAAHHMVLSPPALAEICTRCPALEDLFFGFEWGNREHLATPLSYARRLRRVHVNFPGSLGTTSVSSSVSADGIEEAQGGASDSAKVSTLSERETLELVNACGWSLVRIGSNWDVWEVERVCSRDADGNAIVDIKLVPYEGTEIPEQFLVTVG